jgi:DNA polymerase
MENVSRHRLRWWLRAERALGLRHVHAPGGGLLAAEPAGPHAVDEPVAVAAPAATLTPRVQRTASASSVGADGSMNASASPVRQTGAAQRAEPARTADPAADMFGGDVSLPLLGGATEPFTSPELSADEKAAALRELDITQVKGCTKCPLCRTRRNTVFGEGNAAARLMFIGEGPGGMEDETGRPFVGRAGQKLTEMIEKGMGLRRPDVYICNIVKCRAYLTLPTPKDRPPQPAEAAACMPYLERQIELVRPQVIVTLGLSASQYLLGVKESMSRLRGKWRQWRGIPVMPTFHPSYILRVYTPEVRRAVWEDLKQVVTKLSSAGPG